MCVWLDLPNFCLRLAFLKNLLVPETYNVHFAKRKNTLKSDFFFIRFRTLCIHFWRKGGREVGGLHVSLQDRAAFLQKKNTQKNIQIIFFKLIRIETQNTRFCSFFMGFYCIKLDFILFFDSILQRIFYFILLGLQKVFNIRVTPTLIFYRNVINRLENKIRYEILPFFS